MKREYTIAWIVWGLYVLGAEFLAGPQHRDPMIVAGLIAFLAIEGFALGRPKDGDTLSEHLWKFYSSMPARIPLLIGLALFFGIRLYEVGFPVLELGSFNVGRAVLSLGVVGWLIPHLLARGRLG